MIVLDQARIIVHSVANRPLVAPAITTFAFVVAQSAQSRWPNNPLLNPTLCAIVLVIGFIGINDISYASYLADTQVIGFMLGPTVVLLAVPLYRRLSLIRTSWPLVVAALVVGLPVGILSSVAIGVIFGANLETIYALAPKSVTAGIAMGIEDILGGIPALTAVFVISTGIFGAAFGPWILRIIGIRDHRVIGMAIGVGGHGIGTARAFQLSDKAGAFASLAMALNGVVTAIVIPVAATAMHLHFVPAASAREAPLSPASGIDTTGTAVIQWGSDLWVLLIENQSALILSVNVVLALASFASLYLVAKIIKGGYLMTERHDRTANAASEQIAALERLVGRQALELDRAAHWSSQTDLAEDAIRSIQKTVPFRRSGL